MAVRSSVTDAPAARLTNPWLVLALLLIIYIFNFADRYLLTGLIGPIKQEFQLGDGFMGLLMGPVFSFVYIFLGLPFGWVADRFNRRNLIAAGMSFCGSGVSVMPATPSPAAPPPARPRSARERHPAQRPASHRLPAKLDPARPRMPQLPQPRPGLCC